MNIVAYCRVSTDKEDQLNSLQTQKEFFSEYAKKNHHTLVHIYADEGISGTKIKNRKQFLQLMRDAENGLFDMVVVKDISRLARNTLDLLKSIRRFKALNIETIFLTANMTVLDQSEFALTIFAALAQEESANMSKRVKFGKKENAKKGRVPNIVYGYDKKIGDYFNLAINEEESKIVRQIYHWYIEDGYGASKIAKMLNEKGLKTKRNCNFSQNGVCRILTNEIYIGKIINGKQEVKDFLTGSRDNKNEQDWLVTDRKDLRIIEPDVFEKAQQIMKGRHEAFNVKHERQSNKYLFSTLIKCKECGWSFRRTVRTYKNTYVRWVCSGRNGRGVDSCDNSISIDEEELICILDEKFSGMNANKERIIKKISKEFVKKYKTEDENRELERSLNMKLQKCQKKRKKYVEMYAEDLITKEELKANVDGLLEQQKQIENQLKVVSFDFNRSKDLERLMEQTFQNMEISVRDMTNAQLKQIIDRIEVDKDGHIDINFRLIDEFGFDNTVLISDNHT